MHTANNASRASSAIAPEMREVLVIIVNYRSATLTLPSLESVNEERRLLATESPPINLRAVVVENDSGDEEELRTGIDDLNYGDWVTLIASDRNGGYADGNNLGIAHGFASQAAPDFIHFLNPDTKIRPGAIQELIRFLDEHPKAGLVGSAFFNGDGSPWPMAFRFPTIWSEIESGIGWGLISKLMRRWIVAQEMPPHPVKTDWGPGASIIVRRAVIDRLGGIDAGYFLYFEETDYCLAAQKAGFEFWRVPASEVVHYSGASTGVTTKRDRPIRLPNYWFESRRRYFLKNHGLFYAIACDLCAVASRLIGMVKATILGRRRSLVPFYIRDLLRHSPLLRRNRKCEPGMRYSREHPSEYEQRACGRGVT
ncbi:MAG: glycosyl transferase family 2 [Planctomycetota bacterium]|nr:MAG: glycosyl transferase family 2 [Planctomycetota bacterium]